MSPWLTEGGGEPSRPAGPAESVRTEREPQLIVEWDWECAQLLRVGTQRLAM